MGTSARRSGSRIPVVVLNDTRVDHHHGCSRVMSAIDALVAGIGGEVTTYAGAHTDWRNNPRVLEGLQAARLVLVNGEGTIHHDSPAGLTLLEAAEYARSLGIPSVLLNCAWQDNGPPFFDKLNAFSLVAVRDSNSMAEIRAGGISCRMIPDLSLYQEYVPRSRTRRHIGFTDSVSRSTSLRLERARVHCTGLALPIQYSDPGPAGTYRYFRAYVGKSDLVHPRFIAKMLALRMRQYRSQVPTVQMYLDRLASLELLVSGRFHACTLALAVRTPFVAVSSHTHKIKVLVSDARLSQWRLIEKLSPADIERARRTGWESDEARAIDEFLAFARQGADTLFRDIAKLL